MKTTTHDDSRTESRPARAMRRFARAMALAAALGAPLGGAWVVVDARAAEAKIVDRIVARINDEIVTFYDLRQATRPYLIQRGMTPAVLQDKERARAIYRKVLDEKIDNQLLLQEARKLELEVSERDIDRWLAFTRRQQGLSAEQFQKLVTQYGMTFEEYRDFVRDNLLRLRFVQLKVGSKVSVSKSELESAYRERYGSKPARDKFITVSHILIQEETDDADARKKALARIKKVEQKLAKGADFAELAEKFSEGPSRASEGKLGKFKRGQLDPQFEEVAFELEEGDVSGIVRTKFGYHLIKVHDVSFQTTQQAQERLQKLRVELRQKGAERQLESYLETLRTRAFVDVRL
jgi:peptidyl-prolyl cis-trans isomerase SurA